MSWLRDPDGGGRTCPWRALPEVTSARGKPWAERETAPGRRPDVAGLAYIEQLSVFSAPHRAGDPHHRVDLSGIASQRRLHNCPTARAGCRSTTRPGHWTTRARPRQDRRRGTAAASGETVVHEYRGFALAPRQFAMSEPSEIYCAAPGYNVDTTNLLRVLSRRAVVVATGTVGRTGRNGGQASCSLPLRRFRVAGHRRVRDATPADVTRVRLDQPCRLMRKRASP